MKILSLSSPLITRGLLSINADPLRPILINYRGIPKTNSHLCDPIRVLVVPRALPLLQMLHLATRVVAAVQLLLLPQLHLLGASKHLHLHSSCLQRTLLRK
ncbi:unnamed protein product, partial [Callosobruchus maculatus]